MHEDEIARRAERLLALMEKHLGIRASSLGVALRRAGRRLPRGVRAQAEVLVEAETMAAHPKLAHRIDGEAVERAYRDLAGHLVTIDRAEARKTRIINIAANIAFNLLLAALALLAFLRWRGLI